MLRRVIQIDEELCDGCGACANACHEGAIAVVDGKARLMRDDYCDGLGDCLPSCHAGAISFIEREAAAYDAQAVREALASREAGEQGATPSAPTHTGCPGSASRDLREARGWQQAPRQGEATPVFELMEAPLANAGGVGVGSGIDGSPASALAQWPCQIKLAPTTAPYFAGADLLVAADCTAYAYANMHRDFMAGRVTLIGCPKLDAVDYSEKLGTILRENDVRSLTVVRMEVPCCGGLVMAVRRALQAAGRDIPASVITIGIGGTVLSTEGI